MKLKTLDLFSGIGGFSLGLESTGFFETIGFVEKDKFCQKVLKKHWSNINIEEDIRNVKGEKYQADVVTGGFPCQPFSVAGKRKSTTDDRYLWDEMFRVIKETKSRWVIAENVEGIVNINEGMVLRQVLNDLENEGFKSQCIIIPASGIGAWHQRKRIWIVGCNVSNSNSNRNSSEEQRSNGKENSFSQEHRQKFSTSREFIRTNTNDVPNTESISSNDGRYGNDSQEKQIQFKAGRKGGNGYVPNTNNKGLQGFNSEQFISEQELRFSSNKNDEGRKTWWQTQSRICGVPNGISYELDKDRSNRIKSLGNSIVPQIARQIGLAIMEAENGTR
jgi:DNA (cytosine-5)-methyltransferase 1